MRGFRFQWHITNRCDHRCAHCYQETYESTDASLASLLEVYQNIATFLAAWSRQQGCAEADSLLSITGGEPFLHPSLFPLLDTIVPNSAGLGLAILSNGSLIDAMLAQQVANYHLAYLQVSMEGSPAVHDAIRGAGDHARVMRALYACRQAGIRTSVSFTAGSGNFREFAAVAKSAGRRHAASVWADRYVPIGKRNADHTNVLSPAEVREFFEIMRQSRYELASMPGLHTEVCLHRALQFLSGGESYACQAGSQLLVIMPNGDVYPCRRLPIRVGNVFEQSLETIYRESPLLAQLREVEWVPAGCEPCGYRRQCRGGLRCLAYAVTGDPFGRDPGCWGPFASHALPVGGSACESTP